MVVYLLQEVKCQKQGFCANIVNTINFPGKAVIIEFVALKIFFSIEQLFRVYNCFILNSVFLHIFVSISKNVEEERSKQALKVRKGC